MVGCAAFFWAFAILGVGLVTSGDYGWLEDYEYVRSQSQETMSKFLPIGQRLKEERIRLGMNQTEFGAIGSATRKTQFNYESGERVPDGEYLAALAAAGADVLYILTGARQGQGVPPAANLNRREEALLDNYRNTDDKGKRIIETTASATAEPEQGTVREEGRKRA